MSESTLNRTKNWFRAVGTVSEKSSLVEENGTWKSVPMFIEEEYIREKYEDGKKTGEKFKCKRLSGSIALKTAQGIMNFGVSFYSKGADGKDSKNWAMAEKIMNWVPAINAPKEKEGEAPSYVSMEGSIRIRDAVSKRDGKVYSNLNWDATARCMHVSDDEGSGCTLDAVGYLAKMVPEIVKEQETGRLQITLYAGGRDGTCYPIECFVEKDVADDFADAFEIGQTLDCTFNRINRHIGGDNKKTIKKFSGGKSNVETSTGFDREELILIGADVVEEPEELTTTDENGNEVEVKTNWINPVAMKKAIKAREAMLDELAKSGAKSGSNSGKNFVEAKKREEQKQSRKFAGKTTSYEEFESGEDEDPF